MRVERLRLRNFKCYGEVDLGLRDGVTVIHGVNGSGKTSLLEACFFALYGARALDDRTLDDVIARGENDAKVELWFTHDDGSYRLERRLRLRDERAVTTTCVLETPNGQIEGSRDVRSHVAELLRMDAGAFVNCAYVRQGEVNQLIHASPSDRQDIIDDLLQLGKLEEYRERASDARLGVKTVLDGHRERVVQFDEQIEGKEEKGLHETLNDLETELHEIDAEIGRIDDQIDEAEDTRDEAEEILDRHEERREEIAEIDERIVDLTEKIEETETERSELQDALREERERRDELRSERDAFLAETVLDEPDPNAVDERLDALTEEDDELRDRLEERRVEIGELRGDAERHEQDAEAAEREATEAREEASALAENIEEDERTLAKRRERLSEIDERIAEERARFGDAPIEFGEAKAHRSALEDEREEAQSDLADAKASLDAASADIERAEQLLDAGKCPECEQPVEDSPHVGSIDEKRERVEALETAVGELESSVEELTERIETAKRLTEAEAEVERLDGERENVEQLIDERETALADRRDRIDRLETRAEELAENAQKHADEAVAVNERIDELRGSIASCNAERSDLGDRIERLESLANVIDDLDDRDTEIERLRERRELLSERNDERRESLADRRRRKRELEADVDEERVETARKERDRAAAYLDRAAETRDKRQQRRDEIQNRIGSVEGEIRELEELRERREEVQGTVERLEGLYEEAERLQTTYRDLRAELRRRNVDTLERLLNETFELIYRNDAYAHIELDDDYELTVHGKDGETLDPAQLSGGERALFNLSLRCAIYRLLAEGVEGTAPMPPLILDEPTVFLDSGHVSRLLDLIDSMGRLGVEQIVVVSHDDELVGAADDLVSVEKDPATNRSAVDRTTTSPLAE